MAGSDLLLRVGADLKAFDGAAKEMEGALGGISKSVGDFGGKLSGVVSGPLSKMGDSLMAIGKTVAVTGAAIGAAAVAVGAAAYKIGASFDDAYDTIRVGTGATGKALDGLKDDFRAVAKAVPVDFDAVSQVVADLNKRTGATGDSLQGLSARIIQMSRLTKTDAAANVASATRVFGDWSIATENQGQALDKLFRASQATGIGIDKLQDAVVQFGAPLRAMGFSFDESISLLGKWEKEGVNSELVLGSLRIAMGNFAEKNVPMRKGLEDTFKAIQKLGPGAKSTTLAMETFGARAGPDMAAAILEGRFALGDLLKVVSGGSETILSAAEDTEDFAEKWQRALNRATLAVEPLATAAFGLAADLMERLTPTIEIAAEWLSGALTRGVAMASQAFGTAQLAIEPLIAGVRAFVAYLQPGNTTDLMRAWFGRDFGPRIDEAVRGLKGVVNILMVLPQMIGELFRGEINLGDFSDLFNELVADFKQYLGAIVGIAGTIGERVAAAVGSLAAQLTTWLGAQWAAIDWAAVWRSASEAAVAVERWLRAAATNVTEWARAQWANIDWHEVWSAVSTHGVALRTGLAAITTDLQAWLTSQFRSIDWAAAALGAVEEIKLTGTGIAAALDQLDTTAMGEAVGRGLVQAIRLGVGLLIAAQDLWAQTRTSIAAAVVTLLKGGVFDGHALALPDIEKKLREFGRGIGTGIADELGLTSIVADVAAWLTKNIAIPIRRWIEEVLRDVERDAWRIGDSIVTGIEAGIRAGWNRLMELARALAKAVWDAAYSAIQGGSPSRLFREIGVSMVEGIAWGIDGSSPVIVEAMNRLTTQMVEGTRAAVDRTANVFGKLAEQFGPGFGQDPVSGPIAGAVAKLKALSDEMAIGDQLADAVRRLATVDMALPPELLLLLQSVPRTAGGYLDRVIKDILALPRGVPHLAEGGLIRSAGLAMLHPAEVVVPAAAARSGAMGIDYDRLARAMSRVHLSVPVDDVHGALLRKQRRNVSLGIA